MTAPLAYVDEHGIDPGRVDFIPKDGSLTDDLAQAVIPRSTIEAIVRRRNVALTRFEDAYRALSTARDAMNAANAAMREAAPKTNSYNYASRDERQSFLCQLDVADADDYRQAARRLTDIAVWSHVIEMTELETLMDKEAKDELRRDLHDNPPEVTVDNVYATLQRFMEDADTIWRRGIANAFSKLDRRFRSHDGWKIGHRVILDHAFNEWGSWNYRRNHEDSLLDIERAFAVLDGQKPATMVYASILQKIRNDRTGMGGPRQSVVESDYFRVRIFKNGNAHLWFQRDDLVAKVNEVLADYYGEVLANDRDNGDDAGLKRPKTSLARNFGHFPTPDAAAQTLIQATRH